MHTSLPIISAAGLFDSRNKFTGTATQPRTVIDYELELFTCEGGISHWNGESHPIRKGCILLARPGDRRCSTLHFSALFVHFGVRDPMVRNLLSSLAGFHPPSAFAAQQEELQKICRVALSFEPGSDLQAGAMLVAFLCGLQKTYQQSAAGRQEAGCSAVSIGIEFMKQHYSEPLTVQQIAEHCCLSVSHFHKLFLRTAHATPNSYLTQLRLAAAKNELLTTSASVSEIAARCGFSSQAYFCDCFRKHFRVSPTRFRKAFSYPDEKP